MLRFMIKLPFRIIAAPVWLVLAAVNIVLVFLVRLSAGFCYLIAGISVVTEVLSIGFGISTDWTMKSGMDILKELEEFYMLEKETEKADARKVAVLMKGYLQSMKYQKLLETLSKEQEEMITEYCNAIFSSGAETEEFFYRLGLKDGLNLKNTVKSVLEMIS